MKNAHRSNYWVIIQLLFFCMVSSCFAIKAMADFRDADAPILVIDEDIQVDLQRDGRYVKTTHSVYKILEDEGIKTLSKRYFSYHNHYNSIDVKTAQVIKADGREVAVPKELIYDVSSLGLSDTNIYDENARTRIIVFKGLEVGDTVEMNIVETGFNPPIKGGYSDISLLQDFYPIIKKTFRLTAPKDLPLHYALRDGKADFIKTTAGDRIVYQWQVRQVEKMGREPAMPPLINFAPRLVVSTIERWEDISRWYYHLTKPRMAVESDLAKVIENLTSHLESDREKIERVFRFVSANIRYMGLGTGANKGYLPKPVSETFRTQYGICRDVAALMTAMLNHVGIEAYVTLTSLGYEMEKEIPTLLFNHAIVAIKLDDGSFIYADPTMKNSSDLLVPQERDQDVLVSTREGETLARTPGISAKENMAHIKATSEIKPNGDLTTKITYRAQGNYRSYLYSVMAVTKSGNIKQWIQTMLQSRFPGAIVTQYRFKPESTTQKDQLLTFEFRIKGYGVIIDNLMQFQSPLSRGRFGMLANQLFKTASLPERRYEWNLGTSFGVSVEEFITFPDDYALLSKPDNLKLSHGNLHYQIDYDLAPSDSDNKNTLFFRKKLLVNTKCLTTNEYKHFKFILRAADRAAKGEVILVKI